MTSKKKKRAGNKKSPVTTIPDFIQWVEELEGGLFLYRGLSKASREVETSARRRLRGDEGDSKNEVAVGHFQDYIENQLQEARRRGHGFQDGKELFDLELLAKLQHHGAATCLIDFTTDPLAALWFACKEPNENGKVIAIRSDQLEKFKEITHEQLQIGNIRELLSEENLYKWVPPTNVDNRVLAQRSVFIFGKPLIEEKEYKEIEISAIPRSSLEKYGITEQNLFPDFPGFALSNAHDKPYMEYSADAYFELGLKIQQKGEHEKAIEYYNKAIQVDPNFTKIFNNRGVAKNKLKYHQNAIDDYNKAIQLDPEDSVVFYNRGVAKRGLKDNQGAIDDFNKSIQIKPKYPHAYKSRGATKFSLKDYQGAIEDYNEAIRLNPQHAESYNGRGIIKHTLKDYLNAVKDYNEAILLNPKYAEAYSNRSIVKRVLKDYQGAIEDCNKAIKIKPEYPQAYKNRGIAKYLLKDYQGAIEDYDEAIRLNPQHAESYNERGIVKRTLKDYLNAVKDYDEAIRLNPKYAKAYNNRGIVKKALKDYQGAVEDYNEALRLAPKFVKAYRNRGNAKKELGDESGAEKDFEKAKKLKIELTDKSVIPK